MQDNIAWSPPEDILPSQFFERSFTTGRVQPEKLLLHAMLNEAVLCVQNGIDAKSQRQQRLAEEALDWFYNKKREWPFSFLNICDYLDLDTYKFLQGVEKMRELILSSTNRKVDLIHWKQSTVTIARSSRATCFYCKEQIKKGQKYRTSTLYQQSRTLRAHDFPCAQDNRKREELCM